MFKFIKLFFGNGHHIEDNPAFTPQLEVHKAKDKYASDLLAIKKKARIIEKESKEMSRLIDLATGIAIATGGKDRIL